MKIGIVGYGHVGKLMHKEIEEAIIYDPMLNIGSKEEINTCDSVYIAVPTPIGKDGKCDTSIVEGVLEWLDVDLVILRSTVYVGFTDYAAEKYGLTIVFQPEYYGETPNHPFSEPHSKNWICLGGTEKAIKLGLETYNSYKKIETKVISGPAKDMEMAKYMENSFLAAKVTFVNEMYDIAKSLGVNFEIAREAWLADPRIGESHSKVFLDARGYSGKCLPKDIANIQRQAKENNVDSKLIDSIILKNTEIYKN